MAFSLVGVATDLVSDLGYGGVSLGLLIDSFGAPIPSEVVIPLAVVASRTGRFELWIVALLALAAQVVGATVSWAIGRRWGTAAVQRYGRYVLLSMRDLDRAERAFDRHGAWIAGLGRCLPVIRGFIGYPAGAAGMSLARFLSWTTAGAVVWTGVLIGLGELWRSHVDSVNHLVDKVSYGVVALLVIAVAWHVRHALRSSHGGDGPEGEGISD